MTKILSFPPGFKWGAATAAYQIEGAWNVDGRGESIWDRFSHTPGKTAGGDNADTACEHYYRWPQDMTLMKELGLNAYRFSTSWSRVLPEGRGAVNQTGLDFYSRLVDALLENGIEPYITLYHWDLPQTIQDAGGWLNRRTIDWFAEYADLMVRTLGDRINRWVTFNEPFVAFNHGFYEGVHAPGVKDLGTAVQMLHHLFLAHGEAVRAGRELLPNGEFGIVNLFTNFLPATDSPADREAAEWKWTWENRLLIEPVLLGRYPDEIQDFYRKNKITPVILDGDMERMSPALDFLGVNHYFTYHVSADANGEPQCIERDIPKTDLGWPIDPEGFRDMLVRLTKDYGKRPLYITENGLSLQDMISPDGKVHDPRRISYLNGFLQATHQAIETGADIRGYFHWSLMDNFEWAMGYEPRFGLTYVDYPTQKRIIKDSGRFYTEVIRRNGIEVQD